MIRYRLRERIADFAFTHGRHLSLKEIAEATGIHRTTLSRILNQHGYNATVDNIDKLCSFFRCRVEDLLEHVPELEKTPQETNR